MSAQYNELLQSYLIELDENQSQELLRQLKGNLTPTEKEILDALEKGGLLPRLEIGVQNPNRDQILAAVMGWMHKPRKDL